MDPVQRLIADEILAELRRGRTLTNICSEAWAPAAPTVIDWIGRFPDFGEDYARARQVGYTLMGDEYIDTVRTARVGVKRRRTSSEKDGVTVVEEESDAVDRARLHADGLRWFLSKALPKIYGDKLQVEPPSVPGGGFTLTWK